METYMKVLRQFGQVIVLGFDTAMQLQTRMLVDHNTECTVKIAQDNWFVVRDASIA